MALQKVAECHLQCFGMIMKIRKFVSDTDNGLTPLCLEVSKSLDSFIPVLKHLTNDLDFSMWFSQSSSQLKALLDGASELIISVNADLASKDLDLQSKNSNRLEESLTKIRRDHAALMVQLSANTDAWKRRRRLSSVSDQGVSQTDEKKEAPVIVIFAGNPGKGKSTLANGYLGNIEFPSGVSLDGRGITKEAQSASKIDSNQQSVVVIDTPGLTETLFGGIGSAILEDALKIPGRRTKLNFVFDLRSGRIYPEDIQTIDMICSAIDCEFEYGLIVNKLPRRLMQAMGKNPFFYLNLFSRLFKKTPAYLKYLQFEESLFDEDNRLISKSQMDDLIEFIDFQPGASILAANIREIQLSDHETLVQERNEIEMKQETLRKELSGDQPRLDDQERHYQEQFARREMTRQREMSTRRDEFFASKQDIVKSLNVESEIQLKLMKAYLNQKGDSSQSSQKVVYQEIFDFLELFTNSHSAYRKRIQNLIEFEDRSLLLREVSQVTSPEVKSNADRCLDIISRIHKAVAESEDQSEDLHKGYSKLSTECDELGTSIADLLAHPEQQSERIPSILMSINATLIEVSTFVSSHSRTRTWLFGKIQDAWNASYDHGKAGELLSKITKDHFLLRHDIMDFRAAEPASQQEESSSFNPSSGPDRNATVRPKI